MLLRSYTKEIFRAKCNPGFQSVHCIAHLDQDIGEIIPYLNADLGGFEYLKNPPAVTFKSQGRLITVHADKIAVNALRDEDEADGYLNGSSGRSTKRGTTGRRSHRAMKAPPGLRS